MSSLSQGELNQEEQQQQQQQQVAGGCEFCKKNVRSVVYDDLLTASCAQDKLGRLVAVILDGLREGGELSVLVSKAPGDGNKRDGSSLLVEPKLDLNLLGLSPPAALLKNGGADVKEEDTGGGRAQDDLLDGDPLGGGDPMDGDPLYDLSDSYERSAFLSDYIVYQREAKRYACKICGKLMASKATLSNHVESSHFRGAFNHACPSCDKIFPTASDLARHRRRAHKSTAAAASAGRGGRRRGGGRGGNSSLAPAASVPVVMSPCNVCGQEFPSRSELRLHKKENHFRLETSRRQEGEQGGDVTEAPAAAAAGAGGGSGGGPPRKPISNELLLDIVKGAKEEGRLACKVDVCAGRKFDETNDLLRHIQKMHNPHAFLDGFKLDGVWSCHHCPSTFPYRRNLFKHIEDSHRDECLTKKFICDLCGKIIWSSVQVSNHMKTHEGPVQCPDCGKIYSSKLSLSIHVKEQHTDVARHFCQLCGRCFKRQSQLRSHINSRHVHVRRYKCTECGDAFKVSTTLKAHCRLKHGRYTDAMVHVLSDAEIKEQPVTESLRGKHFGPAVEEAFE